MRTKSIFMWARRFALLGVSPILLFASRFLRNIILSRFLTTEEFGTSVAISVVLSLGELVSDVALDRFVMINNSNAALATAHTLSALRAIIVGAICVAAAPALAALFGVRAAWASFAIACALSAIRGFANLSIKQIQRDYRYGRQTVATVASNILALAAIYPGVLIFHDHRAIVASYGVEFAVYLLCSHLLSPLRFSMGLDRQIAREALAFGLPLTINGAGLAIIYQLDRTLVGYWFGVKELAYYAVILSVSIVPTNLILGIFSNFGMSYLLAGGDSSSAKAERYETLIHFYAITTSLYILALAVSLDVITPLIYGPAYTVDRPIHALLALIAFLRLQRGAAPTTLLLATGRTKALASANFVSSIGLCCAWLLIAASPHLVNLLIGIAFGELISFVVMFSLAEKSIDSSRSNLLAHMTFAFATPAIITAALAYFPAPNLAARGLFLLIGGVIVSLQFFFVIRSNLRAPLSLSRTRS